MGFSPECRGIVKPEDSVSGINNYPKLVFALLSAILRFGKRPAKVLRHPMLSIL